MPKKIDTSKLNGDKRRFILLVSVMAVVVFFSVTIAMVSLYTTSLDQQRERLVATARSQARLIEAVARFDREHATSFSEGAPAATLSQIADAHENFRGFGKTGEFTLARREGDEIHFLLSHRHSEISQRQPIPFDSELAEPMRLALDGLSGTVIGLDYRGERVLAAHEPVAELDLGIVAKIDLAEIRAPFVRAILFTLLGTIVALLIGTQVFIKITAPIRRRIERRAAEVEALLASARVILEAKEFPPTARAIFEHCKTLIGAEGGYVAMRSPDGGENDLLFLDPGEMPCTVDPDLPMPIRGLRAEAYSRNETVFDNDFSNSKHVGLMPDGHAVLHNVLFTPIAIEGEVLGVIGLANKKRGFTNEDAHLAQAFAELASIALRNIRTVEMLDESNRFNETMLQSFPFGISVLDTEGKVLWLDDKLQAAIDRPGIGEACYTLFKDDEQPCETCALGHRDLQPGETWKTMVPNSLGGRTMEIFHTGFTFRNQKAVLEVFVDRTERARAEQQREDLLRLVTHDLSTPLTAIYGFSSLLAEDVKRSELDHQKTGRTLSRIIRNTASMQAMITELVETTQAESGQIVLRKQSVEMRHVLEQLLDTLDTAMDRSRIEIQIPDDLAPVEADPDRLARVLTNLIGNALKYSPEGSPVQIRSEQKNGEVITAVSNSGPGIAPENQPIVFEKYRRLSDKREQTGLGLGLYISRLFVEAHGGRIWVDSEPGKGSTFSFSLPL